MLLQLIYKTQLQKIISLVWFGPNGYVFKDPTMTDWLWEQEECKEQRQRSMSFRKDRQKFMEPEELEKRNIRKLRRVYILFLIY